MSFEITILGCGSALPVVHRNPSAQFLSIANTSYLIDCGEGTQLALRTNHAKLQNLSVICISHLHGDHYLGIMGLISSLNLLGRQKPLEVIGPPMLEDILKSHLEVSGSKLQFELIFKPTNTEGINVVHENKTMTIYSFPLKHRIPCTGFKFQEKPKPANIIKSKIAFYKIPIKEIKKIKEGADFIDSEGKIIKNENLVLAPHKPRSYAYCSDTIFDKSIIPYVKNVDLLYHESTFLQALKSRAKKTFHSTAVEAATIAKEATVEKLILGHYSARYKKLDEFLVESKPIFENTELAEDGKVFIINPVG